MQDIERDDERLKQILITNDLHTSKDINQLCYKAIEKQGTHNFIIFIEELGRYKRQCKITNMHRYLKKCLTIFIKKGATPNKLINERIKKRINASNEG